MGEATVRCTICGQPAADEHRLGRGFYVFCCPTCLPLVREIVAGYAEAPAGQRPARRRA